VGSALRTGAVDPWLFANHPKLRLASGRPHVTAARRCGASGARHPR
jgi:hypothetical protein